MARFTDQHSLAHARAAQVSGGLAKAGFVQSLKHRMTMAALMGVTFIALVWSSAGFAQTRPFLMASTAVQTTPGVSPPFKNLPDIFPAAAIANDVDMVTVYAEYLGIPFDLFAFSAEPPPDHPWTIKVNEMAARIATIERPVLLELAMVRDVMVPYARSIDGVLSLQDNWAPWCLDFNTPVGDYLSAAYKNYALWMTNTFKPAYLVSMIEANLYYVHCGGDTPSWQALVRLHNDTYDWVKSVHTDLPVFPSIKLEDLYGMKADGFDEAHYAALAGLKRDRFGISTYPYAIRKPDGSFLHPFELPLDYLIRVQQRHPEEKTIVIAETGWISDSIAIGTPDQCYAPFPYSADIFTHAYLEQVLYAGYIGGFELINWWSNRDSVLQSVMGACFPTQTETDPLACAGDAWCIQISEIRENGVTGNPGFDELVFKAFGTMGIRRYDGSPKPGITDRWLQMLSLPVARP